MHLVSIRLPQPTIVAHAALSASRATSAAAPPSTPSFATLYSAPSSAPSVATCSSTVAIAIGQLLHFFK